MWYGGKLVLIEMELKPAAFITYMGLAYGVLTPAKSISKALYALKKGNAAAERVYELIDSENEFELQNSFLSIIEILIRDPLTILFTLSAMFIISSKLTFFVLFFIPVSGFFISYIGKSLKRKSLIVQKEQGELTSITEETLNGISVIKAFVSEIFFTEKFLKSNSKFFKYSNSLVNRQNIAAPLSLSLIHI